MADPNSPSHASRPDAASVQGGSGPLPGKGLFGWLGRQVGYVAKAIRHPVGAGQNVPKAPRALYRDRKVTEQPMPGRPEVILRRTTIDEAIVQPDPKSADGD